MTVLAIVIIFWWLINFLDDEDDPEPEHENIFSDAYNEFKDHMKDDARNRR